MQKLTATFLATCACFSIFPAAAQEPYPSRAVNVIVPFQAGHGVDLMARALASEFSKITGQAYPIVNREGAAATIGFTALAAAKHDSNERHCRSAVLSCANAASLRRDSCSSIDNRCCSSVSDARF
jgi:tripartite-type tricarboxylate transporter receptor subunit TctC